MGKKHILVVEDEQHLAIGIQYNLQREGYRVTTVPDGLSALKVFENGPQDVHLVILDLMLAGMSGYDVCEALRAAGHDVPVLILSARTLAEDRTRGFNAGADQYLTKPFDLDELLSRVKNLLLLYERRAKMAAQRSPAIKSFQFGDAKIDFETYEVRVGQRRQQLTQLEMKLLQYFVQNEGRVIPRRELLENVWGIAGYVNTRAPDQFMRRLRKAFEQDPARPRHFLTIRDAGYRFVAQPADLPPDTE